MEFIDTLETQFYLDLVQGINVKEFRKKLLAILQRVKLHIVLRRKFAKKYVKNKIRIFISFLRQSFHVIFRNLHL